MSRRSPSGTVLPSTSWNLLFRARVTGHSVSSIQSALDRIPPCPLTFLPLRSQPLPSPNPPAFTAGDIHPGMLCKDFAGDMFFRPQSIDSCSNRGLLPVHKTISSALPVSCIRFHAHIRSTKKVHVCSPNDDDPF